MEMRRSKQAMADERCREVLGRGLHGVLALMSVEGPYAVPLSYAYDANEGPLGTVYFHCAPVGSKLDAIDHDGRASMCVVDHNRTVPEDFTTRFRSVIAFGTIERARDDAEKRRGLELLGEKYCAEVGAAAVGEEIDRLWKRTEVIVLRVTELTGKEAIEIVRGLGE